MTAIEVIHWIPFDCEFFSSNMFCTNKPLEINSGNAANVFNPAFRCAERQISGSMIVRFL